MNANYYTVIMAGGIGSRFWPLSTKNTPKQFLDVMNTGKSLLRQTFERFRKITPTENILIVTNEGYRDLVKAHLPELDDFQILGEPIGKNTAPCVAYAAQKIAKRNPNASMVVAPSDHLIQDEDHFVEVVSNCLDRIADSDELMTLGIKPSRPDTGYGYIHYDIEADTNGFFPVKSFTEKPILKVAKEFVSKGDYLWNAGIFVWSVSGVQKAMASHMSHTYNLFEVTKNQLDTPSEKEAISKAYIACESQSIDYGIMEKARNVIVCPAEFKWSDIGTWNALYDLLPKDDNNNVVRSESVLLRNTHNSYIHTSGKKLIALNGVQDMVIVESAAAFLIADRKDEQAVKDLVQALKKEGKENFC